MANRLIKDAKDTKSNELIYFRGHAKATYMSDGRSVEDAINNISEGGGSSSNGSTDMSNYYTKTQIDAKGYLTSVPSEYVTDSELSSKGYLTSVPSEYVTETELNNVLGNLKFMQISQSNYDNLSTKDPNTIYIITE